MTKLPRCGKCQSPLPEPLRKRVLRQVYARRHLIVIAAGLVLIAALHLSTRTDWIPETSANRTREPSFHCTDYPQPASGLYASYDYSARVSRLTIKTKPGGQYFIKLEDAVTARPVLAFYMRGGEILEQDVPEGSFILKYAVGEIWCGETRLFGDTTSTNKTERIFEFTEMHGYTVELISRKNGNLRTRAIDRSQF